MGFGVWGLRFGVWGFVFRVWGLGLGVWDLEFRGSGRSLLLLRRAQPVEVDRPLLLLHARPPRRVVPA